MYLNTNKQMQKCNNSKRKEKKVQDSITVYISQNMDWF